MFTHTAIETKVVETTQQLKKFLTEQVNQLKQNRAELEQKCPSWIHRIRSLFIPEAKMARNNIQDRINLLTRLITILNQSIELLPKNSSLVSTRFISNLWIEILIAFHKYKHAIEWKSFPFDHSNPDASLRHDAPNCSFYIALDNLFPLEKYSEAIYAIFQTQQASNDEDFDDRYTNIQFSLVGIAGNPRAGRKIIIENTMPSPNNVSSHLFTA